MSQLWKRAIRVLEEAERKKELEAAEHTRGVEVAHTSFLEFWKSEEGVTASTLILSTRPVEIWNNNKPAGEIGEGRITLTGTGDFLLSRDRVKTKDPVAIPDVIELLSRGEKPMQVPPHEFVHHIRVKIDELANRVLRDNPEQ